MKLANKIGLSLLGALAFAKVLLLFWASNKGIEMSDEGYYLLWFRSAHLYAPDMHLNYYYLVQMLALWVDWDLKAMRIAGILVELASVSVLTWGIAKYLKAKVSQLYSTDLIAWLFIGGVASTFMAEHPRSLSYDSITFFLMSGAGSLLLYWLSVSKLASKQKTFAVFLLLGFVLTAQFLVKFSSAILMSMIWIVALLANKDLQKTGIKLIASLLGIGGFVVWFFATQLDPETLVEYYRISYERISGLGYTPMHIFFGTYVAKDLPHFAMNLAPAILVLVASRLFLEKKGSQYKVLVPLVLSFVVFVVQMLTVELHYFPQLHYRFIDLVFWAILAPVFLLWREGKLDFNKLQLTLVLLLIPFTCAIGSAVNMPMSLFSNVPVWVMLALLLWQELKELANSRIAASTLQYATTLLSFVVFVWVFVWPQYLPHGFAAPLFEQTTKPLETEDMLVDSTTASFITETHQLLQKGDFERNDYLLALYDLPGMVYLMEGYSPQVPWYFGETTRETLDEAVNNTCMHITNISEEHVYILKPVQVDPRVMDCLQNSSLDFPEQYTLQGLVYDPYNQRKMEVWSPNR